MDPGCVVLEAWFCFSGYGKSVAYFCHQTGRPVASSAELWLHAIPSSGFASIIYKTLHPSSLIRVAPTALEFVITASNQIGFSVLDRWFFAILKARIASVARHSLIGIFRGSARAVVGFAVRTIAGRRGSCRNQISQCCFNYRLSIADGGTISDKVCSLWWSGSFSIWNFNWIKCFLTMVTPG